MKLINVFLKSLNYIISGMVKFIFLLTFMYAFLISCNQSDNEIRPWPKNPYYWEYHGKPVILLGGSDDDNLFQWPKEKLENQLGILKACGGNFIRNTMSTRDSGNIEPFSKLENGLYDLDEWNPEYWKRLDNLLKMTAERDIIVQIELWDPHDYFNGGSRPTSNGGWSNRPFNPKNNINYTAEETGLPDSVDYSPIRKGANNHAFFKTPNAQKRMSKVLKYQEKQVRKILEISLPYPNVLYCINNESYLSMDWSLYWLNFVRGIAKNLEEEIYITEMRINPTVETVTKYGFDYADISQSASGLYRKKGANTGEGHYQTIEELIENVKEAPVPLNSVKQYGGDEYYWTISSDEGVERVWRSIFAGQAAVRFHRPTIGQGLNKRAQKNIESLRAITNHFDLYRVKPHHHLSDLFISRNPNSAYVMGEEGRVIAAFFTDSGKEVELDVSSFDGNVSVNWVNTNTAEWGPVENLSTNTVTLRKPGSKQWAALIQASDN